jgi:hypothetical protein
MDPRAEEKRVEDSATPARGALEVRRSDREPRVLAFVIECMLWRELCISDVSEGKGVGGMQRRV